MDGRDDASGDAEIRKPRIRMPIDDRIDPGEWVTEQPDRAVEASQQGAADYEAARRRFETEYGAGGGA